MLKITSYVTFYYNPNLEEVADKICEEMKELVTCLVAWIAFGERNVSHDDFEVLIAKWFWPLTDDDFGSRQRPQDVPIGYHRLKVGAALLLSKQIRIIAWLIFLLLQLLFPLFSPSVLLYTLHSFHKNYLNLALSSWIQRIYGTRRIVVDHVISTVWG